MTAAVADKRKTEFHKRLSKGVPARRAAEELGISKGTAHAWSQEFKVRNGGPPNEPPTVSEDAPTEEVPIHLIRRDGGTQQRVVTDMRKVSDFAAKMAAGDDFPAVLIFKDRDRSYWLVDGHKRTLAREANGHKTVYAVVRKGERREAVWRSLNANAEWDKVGEGRTQEDIAKAIATALADEEWASLKDAELARHIGCDPKTVKNHRDKAKAKAAVDSSQWKITQRQQKPEADPDGDEESAAVRAEANGHHVEEVPGKAPAEDEWLEQFALRKRLTPRCRDIFDRSAMQWQALREPLKSLGAMVRGWFPEGGEPGPYATIVRAFIKVPHPNGGRAGEKGEGGWMQCADCMKGALSTGLTKDGKNSCPTCGGNGFHIPGPRV